MKRKVAATLGLSMLMLVVWAAPAISQDDIRQTKPAADTQYFKVPKVLPSAFAMDDPTLFAPEAEPVLPKPTLQGVPLPTLKSNPYDNPDDPACKITKKKLSPLGGTRVFCTLRIIQ